MTAEMLAEAGLDVVLVDRRTPDPADRRSTSTALVQYEIDTPLVELRT